MAFQSAGHAACLSNLRRRARVLIFLIACHSHTPGTVKEYYQERNQNPRSLALYDGSGRDHRSAVGRMVRRVIQLTWRDASGCTDTEVG